MRQRFHLTTACVLSILACAPTSGGNPAPGGGTGGGKGDTGGAGGSASGRGGAGGVGGSTSGTGGAGGSASGTGGAGGSASGTGGSASSAGGAGGSAASGGSGGASGGAGGATGGSGGAAGAGGGTGGTGGNTGGPDAPAAETGTPAGGAFDCMTTGAKFCSDFENFPAGQAPAGKWTKTGTVVIDSAQAYSGKQSLKFSGPRGSFDSRLKFGADFLPVGGTEFHGRFMVYFTDIPNKTNGGNGCHFDLALASGPGGTYVLGGMYGNFMGVYHPGDCSKDSDQPVPTKKWACVQWQFSGEPGKTHVFRMLLNGKVMPNGEVTDAGPANCGQTAARRWQPPTEFTSLNFGWVNYQSTPIPIEMWVDDFAFGPKPIPCPEGLQ
jgi:hypothetical protein